MSTQPETFQFQTEARQLLDLMVHSVYSHKDIFLRELVSNASDALDKLRFEALTDPDLAQFTGDPHIRISPDPAARTLSVSDNGIGMNRDEIVRFIGTIAKSGTREYAQALQEAKATNAPADLIGQFGVGFYSSFMVADRVSLVTRRAGEEHGWRWESAGDGTYTLAPEARPEPGTTVTLHLKPADGEDGLHDYTDEHTLRDIVRKYSDFVGYPVRMKVSRTESERDDSGKTKPDTGQTVETDEVLNSMKAIWTRPEAEVTDEEYAEFYKHISHDWNEPLRRVLMRAEGTSEFRALLFVPSRAPFDLFMRDASHGVNLYIRRVFIMHDCKDLLPEYLRFVRGVVDSEDLSLNISREILQKNRHIQLIRKAMVKKVLDTVRDLRANDPEKFATFWKEFGRVFKEGIFQDHENREALLAASVFASTHSAGEPVALDDYISRMKPDQERIFYITGDSRTAVENSPHLEAFRAKGYEVLLLSDPVDEVWVQGFVEYKGKGFQSVGKGEAELGSEEERKKADEELKEKATRHKDLLERIRRHLDQQVKEVRFTGRLTSSPACLVGDSFDMTPQLEQMLRSMGQEVKPSKRILEMNPEHPILAKLQSLHDSAPDDERLAEYAELLYGQAVLAEGGQLPEPAAFSRRLADLMTRGI